MADGCVRVCSVTGWSPHWMANNIEFEITDKDGIQ